MSVYSEIMNEGRSGRLPPGLRYRVPRQSKEQREANRKAVQDAIAKAKEAKLKKTEPKPETSNTKYEGPSLKEKLAYLAEVVSPAKKKARKEAIRRLPRAQRPPPSAPLGAESGSTVVRPGKEEVAHRAMRRPFQKELKPGRKHFRGTPKGENPDSGVKEDATQGYPEQGIKGGTKKAKIEWEKRSRKKSKLKDDIVKLWSKNESLKEEEYTPTTRPEQSNVRKKIKGSVKSSGWFKKKNPVSGATDLARVRPHEDDTSHKKLTRAVSWARSTPDKKGKSTLTVAHTKHEGPSLREKLEYLHYMLIEEGKRWEAIKAGAKKVGGAIKKVAKKVGRGVGHAMDFATGTSLQKRAAKQYGDRKRFPKGSEDWVVPKDDPMGKPRPPEKKLKTDK